MVYQLKLHHGLGVNYIAIEKKATDIKKENENLYRL